MPNDGVDESLPAMAPTLELQYKVLVEHPSHLHGG